MRIAHGPRLYVPRGVERPNWRQYGWYNRYEIRLARHQAEERERISRLPRWTKGDGKRFTTTARYVPAGRSFRLVDGHGREYGKRYTAPADIPGDTRVRMCERQEETLHSLMSRLLKAAYRKMIRA